MIQAAPLPRVLHVEDDEDHAILMASALESCASAPPIHRLSSGRRAKTHLDAVACGQAPVPSLVLMDLKMPGVDGFELLTRLKSRATLRGVPVVILTTSDSERDRERAYALHANSYVVKPADFEGWCQLGRELMSYWVGLNRPAPVPDPRED